MTKLSRETEELLARGRGGTPLTPEHRARLRRAILAQAAGVTVVTSAGTAAAWKSLGAKIAGAAVLVAAVGGAGAAIGAGMSDRPRNSLATLAMKSGGAYPATPPSWAMSTQTPAAISSVAALRMATATPASTTTPASVRMPFSTTTAAPTTAPASSPVLTTTAAATAKPGIQAPIGRGTSTPGAAALPSSVVPAPGVLLASAVASALEREVRLLRDADLATKDGDPERALALLDEHAAAFPRSDLEPERSAERVFALCGAGRIQEERNAASAFLSAHPTGPLAARVKDACRAGPAD
jgi:hypothetical protein